MLAAMATNTLGAYIKARRATLSMSQRDLATAADVPQPALSDVERERIKLPNADIRRRLAKALGVSHLDLLIEAGEITREEIEPLRVQGTVTEDPVRAELLDKLARVRLTEDRVDGIEGILDRWLKFDRRAIAAANGGVKEDVTGDESRAGER